MFSEEKFRNSSVAPVANNLVKVGGNQLARLAVAEFDLVLLDLLMPGMGGIETLAAIRFMDIARRLEVADHTKINFHLKMLKDAGLIRQDEKKSYSLTADGEKVIDCLTYLAKTLTP